MSTNDQNEAAQTLQTVIRDICDFARDMRDGIDHMITGPEMEEGQRMEPITDSDVLQSLRLIQANLFTLDAAVRTGAHLRAIPAAAWQRERQEMDSIDRWADQPGEETAGEMTDYLTTKQAAQELGISSAHARRLAAGGTFPGVRNVAGRTFIPVESVRGYQRRPETRGRPAKSQTNR